MLQNDEDDLKRRFDKSQGNHYEKIDDEEKFDITRKKVKTDRPYADPFKAHMMNMQNKLIHGPEGKPTGKKLSV